MNSEWDRLLADLTTAHERAVATVRAARGRLAFRRASMLRDLMAQLAEADADLRGEIAARIAQEQRLTLSGLADEIELSVPRAQQLIKRGRRAQE